MTVNDLLRDDLYTLGYLCQMKARNGLDYNGVRRPSEDDVLERLSSSLQLGEETCAVCGENGLTLLDGRACFMEVLHQPIVFTNPKTSMKTINQIAMFEFKRKGDKETRSGALCLPHPLPSPLLGGLEGGWEKELGFLEAGVPTPILDTEKGTP
eukprot:gene3313-3798_t